MKIRFCLAALSVFSFVAPVFSQAVAGFGGISGVVRDATGAVIPGASVTVSNESKGIRRELTTNEAGVFTAPALIPATGYRVEVKPQGFTAYENPNITLQVGQTVELTITMQVSAAATQVEVTDQTPVIESTKTDTSQVVNSEQITNLPINGRRVDSFVLLTPAVVQDGTFGLISFHLVDAGIVPAAGGVLLKDAAGLVVGAVGVTGDTSDNDEKAAFAGIAAAGLAA